MFKKIVTILIIINAAFAYSQEPAYKKYRPNKEMPNTYYFYLGYTNNRLFVCTDEVKLYNYNGIVFKEVEGPSSKYVYTEIKFLKKGYFTRNTMNHYWYKPLNGKWETIKTPKSNIIYQDTLFGFTADSFSFFNENTLKWQFIKTYKDKSISITTHHPVLYVDQNNNKIIAMRDRKYINNLYFVNDDSLFIDRSYMKNQGLIEGAEVLFNEYTGDIVWDYNHKYFKYKIISKESKISIEKSPFRFKQIFDNPKSFISSGIIEQQNSLNFITFDSILGINYRGNLNIPRANYQKINENLYFVGSFEGMFKVNPNITFYTPHNSGINKNVRSIIHHGGTIWTGGYGSGFRRLDSVGFQIDSINYQTGYNNNILNGGFAKTDNEAYFFHEGDSTMFILKNNLIDKYKVVVNGKESVVRGFYIDTLNDGRIAFALQNENFGILDSIIDDRVFVTSISDKYGIKHGDMWSFDQDSQDRIWLSRFTAGIAVYDLKKDTLITFYYSLENKESFGVISMYIDEFDQLWLGTNKGLYLLPHVSDFDIYSNDIFKKAKYIELPNCDKSTISSIEGAGKYIVAGNRTGLSFLQKKIYVKDNEVIKEPIIQLIYGEDINGSGTEQNCMYYDNERYLWVSSLEGVLKVDMWAINTDTTSVIIGFDYVKNADNLLNISGDEIEINSVKRNIHIKFSPRTNPSFLNNIYYDYILTNSNKDTILYQYRSNNNDLRIDYLNPDNYSLKVNAYKNGLLRDSAILKIDVPYTFGENPIIWFLSSSLLLISLAGFFYFRKEKTKQLSQKELDLAKAENEKTKLKVKAIISTFNPHFINNSLHWVQSRYYRDPEMTKLVGRLSENIDYIFKKTKTGLAVHTLREELNLVRNYITIQQIRFGEDSFEYIEPDMDSINKYGDTELIVLQIQIHVENAVEHGIRNRVNSSFVKVELSEDKHSVIIEITDDGVGRAAAKKLLSRGNQTGVKMLNELYKVYNRLDLNMHKIESKYIDDIFNDGNSSYGTKVIIKVPKKFIFRI